MLSLSDDKVEYKSVKISELEFIPCQACGKAPTPEYCFYDDDMSSVYNDLASCDAFLFGSPVYFDSVSAQAKAFIDRCNCMRPANFGGTHGNRKFVKLLNRRIPGGIVLVGGENCWFEGARRTIAGFFKWIEIENTGLVTYDSRDYEKKGTVSQDSGSIGDARNLGVRMASMIGK